MIHVGVLGCGKIAQVRHLPEYAANPQVKLATVYDIDGQRAKEMAQRYGCRWTTDMAEIIRDPHVDAVSICIPNHLHAEATIAALENGKHVLCEKPMAMTLPECEKMVDAAEKSGKYLMIGMNQRLTATHMRARQLIRDGAIGRPLTFRTTFGHGGPETWTVERGNIWFFDKTKATMGTLSDLGIHKTDLIQFLTSQRVVRTTAHVTTLDKRYANGELIGVDDNAYCIYEMSGGAVGTMTASWTFYGAEDNSTVLYGTKGIMRIYDDPAMSIKVYMADGTKVYYDVEAIQTNDNQTKSGVIDLWMESLVNDTAPEISGESALTAMRAVFASIQSSEIGKAVEIPENK